MGGMVWLQRRQCLVHLVRFSVDPIEPSHTKRIGTGPASMHHARPQFHPCQPCRKHRRHYRQDRHHRPANVGQEVFILAPDRPAQGNVGLPFSASPARIGLSPPKARIVCQWAYRPFNVAKTRRRHHRPQAGHARRQGQAHTVSCEPAKRDGKAEHARSTVGRVGHTVQCDPTPGKT